MKKNYPTKNKSIIALAIAIWLITNVNLSAQIGKPFIQRYQANVRGGTTFLANGIVNRETASESPNDPYNDEGSNNDFYMEYIDVDSDPNTFNSSSSTLSIPSCSAVAYAGLYWAAVYESEYYTDPTRFTDFNTVNVQVPGGSYVTITADDLFDGNTAGFSESPYVCYADITSLITPLADPNGEYTVANIRTIKGGPDTFGGGAGGWVIVIVYENPTLPGKYISLFDGYAAVEDVFPVVDFSYNGFNTIPTGPVRAQIGIAALEGDRTFNGDELQFRANGNAGFTNLHNTLNPPYNFFNSNITINNAHVTSRNITGTNTLGFDADILTINNPNNSVIGNNETGATIRVTTSLDRIGVFLNTLEIEIIEPSITLTKTVEDLSGNDVGGTNVTLGDQLNYILSFQNIGNDDATNYTIRDVLPTNVDFIPANLTLPTGVTYTYNATTHEIVFTIPNNLIEVGDPEYQIQLGVQVVNSCNDLRDACSNTIQNQAYSYYQGVINTTQISDDPSFAGFDSCNFGIESPTNFLVDVDDCTFERTEILCGTTLTLTAGNGFTAYQWEDSSGNVIGNSQSVVVSSVGTYTVTKTADAPCLSATEIVNVELFGNTNTNPVIPYADEVVTCPNDGDSLANIFLCGANDSRLIQTNISDASSIEWEQLDENSCAAVGIADCANKNSSCTWNNVGSGNDFSATDAGEYRMVINYQNGCFSRFYFNVYKNTLNPTVTEQDIICSSSGQITINNVPVDYEYSLDNPSGPYQNSNTFSIPTAGVYTVYIRQVGVGASACIFSVPNIGIQERNFSVDVTTQDVVCAGNFGSIQIQVNDVAPNYYYQISGTSSDTFGPSTSNNYTFTNLNAGTYQVDVTTDDGCSFTQNVTIQDNNNLSLTATVAQNAVCGMENVLLNVSGGTPTYNYSIHSIDGVVVNTYNYQTSNAFNIASAGTYEFIVVDSNNCTTISNPVDITIVNQVPYTTTITDVTCFGANNGSITFNYGNTNGYTLSFSIDGGNNFQTGNAFYNLAPAAYNVVVRNTINGSSCDYPTTITISEPTAISGNSVRTQNYTCSTTGTIEIQNATGGITPYEYSLDGGSFSSSNIFTGLNPGTYNNITIRDANGCTFVTNPITVDPANEITALNFSATPISCPLLTSDVTVTTVGGTAPFNFEIIAPATSTTNNSNGIFSNLSPSTYTFLVTDVNGCTFQNDYTITNITPINITGQVLNDVTCVGDTNGSLSFTVSGSSSYEYTINGGSVINETNATVNLTNLAAGNYVIDVNDPTTNCSDSVTLTIAEPASTLSFTHVVNPLTCNASASVAITATGGWGNYEYELEESSLGIVYAYQTSNIFDPITAAGNYTIRVRDNNGCVVTDTFTITNPVSPTVSLAPVSNLCYATTTGMSLIATASGGVAPYQYSLNGSAYQSNATFSNLTPGNYSVMVIDNYGCTATSNIVTVNGTLTASASLIKDLDCTASPDGRISININDGYPNYSYEVSFNGGAFGTLSAVSSNPFTYPANTDGTYQFRITDSEGCTVLTNIITITPAENPIFTVTTQDVDCNGGTDGSINVTIDNTITTPPYQVSIDGGSTFFSQTSFFNLNTGSYDVVVRDAKACETTTSVTINEPNIITTTVTENPVMCSGTPGGGNIPGSIDITNTLGGTAPYTYTLYDNANNVVGGPTGPTSATSTTFNNLQFGDYYVSIVDTNGCEYTSGPHRVESPPFLNVTATIAALDCPTGATIEITASGGSGNYTFQIYGSGTAPSSVAGNVATFVNLTPGLTYAFEVIDNITLCSSVLPDVFINSPSSISVTLDATTNVSCNGNNNGSIDFTVANYSATVININYDVLYAITNTSTGITGSVVGPGGGPVSGAISNLPPGDYILLVEEASSTLCSATVPFRIEEPLNALSLTQISNTNANCNTDSQVAVDASGGTAPYTYAFVPSGVTPIAGDYNSSNAAFLSGPYPAIYDVYVMDANGCLSSISVTVNMDANPTITAPALASDQCTSDGTSYTFSVSGTGVAPLEYSIGGGYQTSDTFTVTAPGTYTITIRDANGCTNTDTITIYSPITTSAAFSVTPTCNNADGEITITASGGNNTFEYDLLDSSNVSVIGGVPQNSPVFSGLIAGNYTAVIIDVTTSCSTQVPVNLSAAIPVGFTTSTTNVSCNGGSDGSITISLDAGNTDIPYIFNLDDGINPTITQNSPVFSGLAAGNYTLTVQSGRNCTSTQVVNITEPAALSVSAVNTDFGCAADNTVFPSMITIIANQGTAPYSYSINGTNFFSSNTFNITDTGAIQNITVTVRDANNCEANSIVTINPLQQISNVTINQDTAITCTNDEQITINVTGGSTNFTYALLPNGPSQVNNGTFTLSNVGDYTFQITDNVTGCYTFETYTVAPFNLITANATTTNNISCFGSTDGSIAVDVLNYNGNYTYQVFDGTGNPVSGLNGTDIAPGTLNINAVPSGVYTISITETAAPFCQTTSNTVVVSSPSAALAIALNVNQELSCNGNDAQITAITSGGWGSYEFRLLLNGVEAISYATNSTNNVFSNLGAGNYTVEVRDSSGCVSNSSQNFVQPSQIVATATQTGFLACEGDTTGTISVTATGGQGTGNYAFVLNNLDTGNSSASQTSATFSNLAAGTYTITVSDNLNCNVTTNTVTITEPTEVIASLTQSSTLSCNSLATIEVSANGGVSPYQYSTDGITFSPSNTFTVGAGNYQYYARDANGCISNISNEVIIEPIEPLTVTLDLSNANINCFGEATAVISATASGGLGNYQYTLLNVSGTPIAGPQTSNTFEFLPSGMYSVQVDSGDCVTTSITTQINDPVALTLVNATSTDITCAGANDGTILVETTGGTGAIQYAISPNLDAFDTVNFFQNLAPGTYDVIVQDEAGCFFSMPFNIIEPAPLIASPVNVSNEICSGDANGSLEIAISGGAPPYFTSLNTQNDNNFVQDQTLFTNLAAGTHVIFIRDSSGCQTNIMVTIDSGVNLSATVAIDYSCIANRSSNTVTIHVDSGLLNNVMFSLDGNTPQLENVFYNVTPGDHTVEIMHSNGCNSFESFNIADIQDLQLVLTQNNLNEITANASGGNGNYEFFFNGTSNGSDNTYYINETGTYTVLVRDANGCEITATIFMEFIDIIIPDHFTPNGDGNNDEWGPNNRQAFPNVITIVYDRYGRLIAELNPTSFWDGTYNGKPLPTGDYWYVIKINGQNDGREFVGHFTLYR